MAEQEKSKGDAEPDDSEKPKCKPLNRKVALTVGAIVVCVLAVIAFVWWLHARNYESTDDAFIDAHVVRVAPRVAGQITRVLVRDNELVAAGDLLVEIDPADTQSRLSQAISQRVEAQTQLAQARAQLPASAAARDQALATAAGAQAQADKAWRDLSRYRSLHQSNPKAVSQTQLDQIATAAEGAKAQRDAAREQVRSAEAQIDEARLNLGYTRIVAPFAGHVTQKSVAAGSYVAPGQEFLAIVPLDVWVTDNFKETQLALMRPSPSVQVSVDACPKVKLPGHVDSIQRGAGQAFALLPAENATGNFVKVVQRVPVKIILDRVPRDCPLGPGMSVEPRVQVR